MESKKTCAIVQDLLPAYIDKLTKPETTAFVDAHLTDCEACRRVCRNMSGTLPAEAVEAENVVQRLKNQHYRRVAIGWGIVLTVFLIAAICFLPIPKDLNITQEGVLWRCGTSEEMQITTVQVVGTYYDHPLRKGDFKGTVWVEVLPETHGEMSVVSMGDNQYGVWYETEDALLKSLGGQFVRKDGSVLVLLHEDGHWDAENGLVLTAPASTREEAVALTNELAKELSPNWLGSWTFK